MKGCVVRVLDPMELGLVEGNFVRLTEGCKLRLEEGCVVGSCDGWEIRPVEG